MLFDSCACTSGMREDPQPPEPDEMLAMVVDGRMKALYRYDREKDRCLPVCVFDIGVYRGLDL